MLYSVCHKKIGQMLFCCAVYFCLFCFPFPINDDDIHRYKILNFLSQIYSYYPKPKGSTFPEALINWHFITLNQSLLNNTVFQMRQVRQYSFIQTRDNYLYINLLQKGKHPKFVSVALDK